MWGPRGYSRQKAWGSRNWALSVLLEGRAGLLWLLFRMSWRKEGDFKVQVGPGSESPWAHCPGVPGSNKKKAFQQPCGLVICMLRKDHSREGLEALPLVTWLHYLKKALLQELDLQRRWWQWARNYNEDAINISQTEQKCKHLARRVELCARGREKKTSFP